MTIKEVEKATGLTAKSIRLYESRGLLNVSRRDGNDYREYTEENVNVLKKIKLYRFLDFSIEEIKTLLGDPSDEKEDMLQGKLQEYSELKEKNDTRSDVLKKLISDNEKGCGNTEKHLSLVEFFEGETWSDFSDLVHQSEIETLPTMTTQITTTLLLLGPIVWLFIRIIEGKLDRLILTAVLALASTVILTLNWKKYFTVKRYAKKQMKKQNRKHLKFVKTLLIFIVIIVLFSLFVSLYFEKILAPDGWLFYETDVNIMTAWFFCTMFILYSILGLDSEDKRPVLLKLSKVSKIITSILIVAWLVIFYLYLTNVTFVTDDTIVVHTPTSPAGKCYSYSDVTMVEAKFGSKKITLNEYEKLGNFTYTVYFGNEREVFHIPTVNKEIDRYFDTYLELEEFDSRLMKFSIPKVSSDANADGCDFDKNYVERFIRIINNK